MALLFLLALSALAAWFAKRSLQRRRDRLSRTLALAAISTTLVPCAIWIVVANLHTKSEVARWGKLRAANPGKTLAELAPGFSMTGAFEGMMFFGFATLCVIAGVAAIHPPNPDDAFAIGFRRGADLAILSTVVVAGLAGILLSLIEAYAILGL